MELKRYVANIYTLADKLLIVPYGIETAYRRGRAKPPLLLIVPYGIETNLIQKVHSRINCF